jgi:hypothetical protein
VHESERCNRLPAKRLPPELQRHQPFAETPGSEFESLPPSQSTRIRSLTIAFVFSVLRLGVISLWNSRFY